MPFPKSTPESDAKRFWSKVDKSGGTSSCWPWIGPKLRNGYGQFSTQWEGQGRRTHGAHRFAYFLHHGHFTKNHTCHSCDNRTCCNPSHLWDGTQRENVWDCKNKGRARYPIGEQRGPSKLTEKEVIEIRRLAAMGIPKKELAHKYKVAPNTISQAVSRVHWKHVP